jgi:hypothetical protein
MRGSARKAVTQVLMSGHLTQQHPHTGKDFPKLNLKKQENKKRITVGNK